MNEITDRIQDRIRHAVQSIHKKYRSAPFVFLTEADAQCMLYSELLHGFSKKAKSKTSDLNGKKLRDWDYQVITIPLHAELSSSYRKKTEYVDLCIIDPPKFEISVQKKNFNRSTRDFYWQEYQWSPGDSVGIEIKVNWVQNRKWPQNGRSKITKNWKDFEQSLIVDLWKLRKYKRGWLILIDNYSTFKEKNEWREIMERLIRHSNYGSAKKTLNAYYLCPKRERAISYKPQGNSF